ncbi:MAG: HDIG domain-containing protein [Chloroflexi bacterium]|nr:HDIG domain-containing protein [Chloroflexota bacterium]MBU1748648.1 HDIG domain-containing protein [Chloroflexota bacterium]
MEREVAWQLVQDQVGNANLRKHMLATEAVMQALARHLGEDEALWGLAGLLHDIDYDETYEDPARHGLLGAEMLAERGVDPRIVQAVRAHNEMHGLPRETRLDMALYAVDPLTGLIIAAALIRKPKKLAPVTTEFILNRFKEKGFARGANREQIASCEELGLTLDEFVGIGLEAMQGIADDLGL